MKQIKLIFSLAILLPVMFASCQKVININLGSSASQYVVQGDVTDSIEPFHVSITQSVNYNEDNVFPAVSGAIVTITDATTGQIDSLTETPGTGYYQSAVISRGIPGHTYNLYININGKILTATSTMPQVVTLDSLYAQVSGFRGNSFEMIPVYTDPVAKGNYYRFVLTKNDTISNGIYVRNDQLVNGQTIKQPIGGGGGGTGSIIAGDDVTVELQCIDSMTYQFYFTLSQSQNENSATPTNPVSNIVGGQALGYFSAHTSRSLSMFIP